MKRNPRIGAGVHMLPFLTLLVLGACIPGPTQSFVKRTGDLLQQPFQEGALALSDTDDLVVQNPMKLYAGPSNRSAVQGLLREGDQVRILNTRDGWTQVSFSRQRTGWICSAEDRSQ